MFEISGNDITTLSDIDLRSLIARLAIAELRTKGCPRSSVIAGGNQDAADGGLDVRVECPTEITDPDFVPRRLTGFQVKKPDMPPGAIRNEMRPKGVLRDVIRELADASGAYVIVSSQGSVADKPLGERRKAMRSALSDLHSATQLHTDFYDRDRLANWVNEYPGMVAWVRRKVGRSLSGWSSIGAWDGGGNRDPKPYLSNEKTCLIDEHSHDREHLTIAEGITRLRAKLGTPKQCIRLVGLSGLGKTRLVQALFEENVGENPLDSSIAVYTDYSEETDPTARDMARELIANRLRAILVVDNCNPATHSELARLCAGEASELSLITVEYDVRDDEPEHTEVFRLQSASPELVSEWIKQCFPHVSQIDREKIAEFSDGNFRVGRALAETLGRGETLGTLKSRELFERIFRQRNEPDQQLLRAAEDLSLLYSINGEDVSDEGELARAGAVRDIDAQPLYEALAEMRQRGVVQARGRFRAIMPQAIANPLAANALKRIPPAHFDRYCRSLPRRMLVSVSRRLGFLHDSDVAQATVVRWLRADGPLGDLLTMGDDGFQIITNIAPVAPEAVLARFEKELNGPDGYLILAPRRHQWIPLIKAIGYDAHLFDAAVTLLARFAVSEPESNNLNSARNTFSDFFHLYLSGTQATPEQRRSALKRLAASGDEDLRRSADIALRALLKSDHFMSTARYDFGARSRDWGWHPKINKDIWDWFEEAISLVLDLGSEAESRALLADNVRGLWRYPTCRDALERAATEFVQKRPWIEGWIAFRATLRFDGKDMPNDVRTKLEQIINRLKPLDLLNRARAIVVNRASSGWDFADGEDDEGGASNAWKKADRMAQEVGRLLANDAATRADFIADLLVKPQAHRAFECGRGLAEGADDLNAIWLELVIAYGAAESQTRNGTLLGGFICEAHQCDQSFTSAALEGAINNPDLLPILPYLQARAGIDNEGIARLRRAVARGGLVAWNFDSIANGSVSESPPEPLAVLLKDIATLPEGVEIALEILHMHFYCNREKGDEQNRQLVLVGRELLAQADFSRDTPTHDFGADTVIRICLAGDNSRAAAEKVCENIRSAIDSYRVAAHSLSDTLEALFETQPFVALDSFLLPNVTRGVDDDFHTRSPIASLDPTILQKWASHDPNTRYPLLGTCLKMFGKKNGDEENEISSLFMLILEQAPDKRLFLGDLWHRVHPRSWSGSLAHILLQRKARLMKLVEHPDEQVRAWVANVTPELDRWIDHQRLYDREREESFE